jgi:hypothetical protein
MRCSFLLKPGWIALMFVTQVLVPSLEAAQLPVDRRAALQGVVSPDLLTREKSFYLLIGPASDPTGYARQGVSNLLRSYPDSAEQIRLALIAALELAGTYRLEIQKRNDHFDETFSEYYADLISAVSNLRDPRALKGLLGAIDTGGMARRGLADLGPVAVDAVIEKSHDANIRIRSCAISVLGEFLERLEAVQANPEAAAKAHRAIKAALDDPDSIVRSSAAGSLATLRDEPDAKARLEAVASSDPGASWWRTEGRPEFPARDSAAAILALKEEDLYYVIRTPETRQCRVQRSTESAFGVRHMGPYTTPEVAAQLMCSHYDDTSKDPAICWSVQPKNACRQ